MRSTWGSFAIVWAACDGGSTLPDAAVTPDAPDAMVDPRQTVAELAVTPNRDLDLLFVIDDSPSMLDKQTNLIASFPVLINRLMDVPGGLPNLHIGVVTTDMGTTASLDTVPGPPIGQIGQGGCAGTGKGGALQTFQAPVTGRFLVDVEAAGGGRTRNYTGTLDEAFGMMARAGAGGCGFEQPLRAVKAALDNHPMNAGFLRAEAILGVVFLTDEDDCSAKATTVFGPDSQALGPLQSFRCTRFGVTCAIGGQTWSEMNEPGAKSGCAPNTDSPYIDDVAPYREFLRGLKSDPRRVIVGGIHGPAQPVEVELRQPPGGGTPQPAVSHSCSYTGGTSIEVADPGVRIQSFFEGFPDRSTSTTICQSDLTGGLARIGQLFQRAIGTGCVERRLTDVNMAPGLQVDCVVEDLVGSAATRVEACEANPAARPCWQLEVDAVACASSPAPNLKLVVQRAAAPDPATVTRMRCLIDP